MNKDEYTEYEWIDEELAKVKEFFMKIEDVLHLFAKDHNLRIEKYYHYIPGWEFLFRHQLGGQCYIEILKSDKNNVSICGCWSLDNDKSGEYFNKHTERVLYPANKSELPTRLYDMLKLVLSWTKDDLELTSKRSPEIEETMTEEEIKKDMEQYPVPKW